MVGHRADRIRGITIVLVVVLVLVLGTERNCIEDEHDDEYEYDCRFGDRADHSIVMDDLTAAGTGARPTHYRSKVQGSAL